MHSKILVSLPSLSFAFLGKMQNGFWIISAYKSRNQWDFFAWVLLCRFGNELVGMEFQNQLFPITSIWLIDLPKNYL
jgi:hypothetical protein